jgi:phosphotransferase system HPr (HPr) family protein
MRTILILQNYFEKGSLMMTSTTIMVNNSTGLHARPATQLIHKASMFDSAITIKKGEQVGNAESLLSILSMAIGPGEEIEISAHGSDEQEAVAALVEFVCNLGD